MSGDWKIKISISLHGLNVISLPYRLMFCTKKKDNKPSEFYEMNISEEHKDKREQKYLTFLDLKEFKTYVDQAEEIQNEG